MRQKSLFDGAAVSIFCFFCTCPALSAENSFLFMSILSKDLHPSAAVTPFRSAAPLLCGRTVPVYAFPPRKAHGHGLFSSHQQLLPPATSLHCAKRKPPALFFTLTALAEMVGSPAGHGLFSSHQQLHYTMQKENRQRFSSR